MQGNIFKCQHSFDVVAAQMSNETDENLNIIFLNHFDHVSHDRKPPHSALALLCPEEC